MIYAPRKVVFPFFVAIFSLAFFAILTIAFFYQPIETTDSSVSIVKDKVVLKTTLHNTSFHRIDGLTINVNSSGTESNYFIKGVTNAKDSFLDSNESYEFVVELPLSGIKNYPVLIKGFFVKQILINFALEDSTTEPVTAEVFIPSKLTVNKEYTYSVKLCNVSGSDLPEVIWFEDSEKGLFKENFFEKSISIRSGDCKPLYSTLTPIKTGSAEIWFYLKVGSLEKKNSKVIEVIE